MPDSPIFRWLPACLCTLASIIGLTTLVGWHLDIALLTSYADGRPLMSIIAALLLTLASSLMLLTVWPRTRPYGIPSGAGRLTLQFLGGGVTLLALSSVMESLFSDIGDTHPLGDIHSQFAYLFFPDAPWAALHASALTASGYTFVGLIIMLASGDRQAGYRALHIQLLCLAVLQIAFLGLVGQLFDARELYIGKGGLGLSLPASIGFLCLGTAAMALQPNRALMATVTSRSASGRMLRWLSIGITLAMVSIEWLVVAGHEQDLYDNAFSAALSTLAATTTIGLLLYLLARRLDKEERKARDTQELLETLFANIQGLIAYMDRDFRFIRVNEAYAAAVNQDPAFFIGKGHFELYPNAENEAIFQQVVATGQPYVTYAKPFAYPDRLDHVSYWDWVLSPVRGEDGQTEGLLLTLNEVTERKRAEDERLRAEREFRQIFDAASDALFVLNLAGQFIAVNETACNRLGYTREELLQMGPASIDTPEFRQRIPERTEALMQFGESVFESEHCTRDGRRIPVEISSRKIEFAGQPAILSMARDISMRKSLEQMERANAMQTAALLNSSRESAILIAPDGRILSINQTGALRLKSTPEALIGQDIYAQIPPEVAQKRRTLINQVIAERRPILFQDKRAGLFLDHSIYPILNERGEVAEIAIHAVDITDKIRALGVEKLFQEIDRRIQQGLHLDALLSHVCEELVQLFDLSLVWIGGKQAEKQIDILAMAGPARAYRDELEKAPPRWDDSPLGHGPAGSAIRTGRTQLVDLEADVLLPWQTAIRTLSLKTAYAIPLTVEGEIFGVIAHYSDRPDFFAARQIESFLGDIASRLCVAISFARQHEQMQLLSKALSMAGNAIFITDELGRIQWVNDAFTRLTGYTLIDAYQQTPRLLKSGKQDAAYYDTLWTTIRGGHIWSHETIEKRKNGELFTVQQTITPILNADGKITHFVSIQEDITEKKATEEHIQHMAYFDALTDLPNRALFFDRLHQALSQARRNEQAMAVFFLDLDRFKQVNDKLGHEVGDLLLKGVARRLEACVRESDTVARLGGDEFTIILANLTEPNDAAIVAQKIVASLSVPFELAGQQVVTGTSIGIALHPEHGSTSDELIKAADDAMYVAKSAGRGTYRFSGAEQAS